MTANPEVELRVLLDRATPEAIASATTLALTSYGPELVGWLCATLGETDAHDAFSILAEELWKSLPRFDGRCSARTWCYMLARAAVVRVLSPAMRRREQLVSHIPSVAQAAAHVWTTTAQRQQRQQSIYAQIRSELDDDDQLLLVLRVDRDLAWSDIALVMLGETASADEVARKAATLRKQFERVKQRLRELAAEKRDS